MSIHDFNAQIPVMSKDSFISKAMSFYRMGELSAEHNEIKGWLKRKMWTLRVMYYSFKMFRVIRKQQAIMAQSMIGMTKMARCEHRLNEHGVAYRLNLKIQNAIPDEHETIEMLKNLDASRMPKN